VTVKPVKTSKKLAGDVEIFGLQEMQQALRKAPPETRKRVNAGSKEVAEHVVKLMKVRARTVPHARQYELVVPSLRAIAGRTPRMRIGGTRKARVSRKPRPSVGEFLHGVEFGGRARKRTSRGGSTMQFPPHLGRKGYVIFPTIVASHEFIKKEYSRQIEKVLKGL
jgi:hypothetical protein